MADDNSGTTRRQLDIDFRNLRSGPRMFLRTRESPIVLAKSPSSRLESHEYVTNFPRAQASWRRHTPPWTPEKNIPTTHVSGAFPEHLPTANREPSVRNFFHDLTQALLIVADSSG